ncbi:Clp protease N-terminal domain-containing protein [Streptomyces sp. NPDC091377]|uniref:Clp protease N-terminal domain-containing protein n=1 Tax=Streptomyces sp. NPDC091377 TaxID=3365995 RepID=UPI0038125E26
MDQRETGAGATTEFEPDVVELLVATARRAVRSEWPDVGTDTLLGELVSGDSPAGDALAPGMRTAGSLAGRILAYAGVGWVSDDPAPEDGEREDDGAAASEVDAVWREALWRYGLGLRGAAKKVDRDVPAMTGALRACLLDAFALARAEGTVSVRCRQVARALLDRPGTRAREAMTLERLDLEAASAALDAVDAAAPRESERPESQGVTLLRRSGTVGKSGNRLTRALTSWAFGSALNGSPVVAAVSAEAVRQAVRRGRDTAEPADLLLGVLALDRGLSVAGHTLSGSLADVNRAAALLRRHGVRQTALVRAASAVTPAGPVAPAVSGAGTGSGQAGEAGEARGAGEAGDAGASGHEEPWLSGASERVVAVARLRAAEHGSETVGTVHLLVALLEAAEPDVERLLRAGGADRDALRAELCGRWAA